MVTATLPITRPTTVRRTTTSPVIDLPIKRSPAKPLKLNPDIRPQYYKTALGLDRKPGLRVAAVTGSSSHADPASVRRNASTAMTAFLRNAMQVRSN